MKIFKESQRFNQWWLYTIIIFVQIGILIVLYQATSGFTVISDPVSILVGFLSIFLITSIFLLQLRTKIDATGIQALFYPIKIFSRKFTWNEIEKTSVRKYSPITEFGGWGIRGIFPAKAYTISGNYGIQIVTKEGGRFLIGTHKPEEVKAVLENYQKKLKQRSNYTKR